MSKRVPTLDVVLAAGSLVSVALFLTTSFRYGWTREATDFRNYYTGAILVTKAEPLRNYYDWSWFQRQMNRAGIDQIGSYVPQTPLAMLPLVPVSALPVQTAKRVWLIINLALLGTTLWMLTRLTNLTLSKVILLACAGFGSLHFNFLFGQYYVLLLFLITAALFYLDRGEEERTGLLLSIAFTLKLYGAPFLLYLAARRHTRSAGAMMFGAACFIAIAISIFGWSDMLYYGSYILPRSLLGETIDPYNSLNNTNITLLRRLFMTEPELNPHPLWNSPVSFYFLQGFITLMIFAAPLMAIVKRTDLKETFALFCLSVLLASPNLGSYTYVLAFLPVVLLFDQASRREQAFLILCYFALGLPMNSDWSRWFPKLWILWALFLYAGRGLWHVVRPFTMTAAAGLAALLAGVSASSHVKNFHREPDQLFEHVAGKPGTIFSSSPAIVRSGIVSQALSQGRYLLRWTHDGRIDDFPLHGYALDPVAESPDGPVHFDLLYHGQTARMTMDLQTANVRRTGYTDSRDLSPMSSEERLLSPDGRWVVSAKRTDGITQLWMKQVSGGSERQLTYGNCSSWAPVWELDSKAIVFASDCNRGIGCPTLYRAFIR